MSRGRIATGALRPRNDREFYMGAGNVRRDDVGIVPYEIVSRGAVRCGIPQSRLRRDSPL